MLVALDCTAEVAREACQRDFDLVLTHHPVIFRGLKTLVSNDPAVILAAGERTLFPCTQISTPQRAE